MHKEIIIYIYPSYLTFVEKDIDFLSRTYTIKAPKHNWSNKFQFPFSFIRQLFFLSRHIYSSKAVVIKFGGYWSFLPALFGKIFKTPVFIILGGTDCVSFPSVNYGSLRKPILKIFIKWSYLLCSELLPVDKSLVFCNYSYSEQKDYKNQGYKFFFPQLTTKCTVIHNGFDTEHFNVPIAEKESHSFITVAAVSDMIRFHVKGINQVFQLAKIYTRCTFTVVGVSQKLVKKLDPVPDNVILYPFLRSDQFKKYLSKSEFYLQLSISEGFPNALCEAMSCRCIPVGSSVGATPFIIKDTGFIIESTNPDYLKTRFDEILSTTKNTRLELAAKARNRIVDNFHISKREKSMLELINQRS